MFIQRQKEIYDYDNEFCDLREILLFSGIERRVNAG